MKKDCSLIVTFPRINSKSNAEKLFENDDITALRLNTGVNQLLDNKELLTRLKELSDKYKKVVWIDIKGRQLRIESWADLRYENIKLNHEIDIEYPAFIEFRNGSISEIFRTRKNEIELYNPPKEAVGKGQSINIKAKSLEVKGYLTEKDKEILKLSHELELNNIMASFVEQYSDLIDILRINQNATITSKIESVKGIKFMLENPNLLLMAARDDLYIELPQKIQMLKVLRTIIQRDKNAICASKVFDSLEKGTVVSLQDYEDLELMYSYGYKNYMLGDNTSNYNLSLALSSWKEFINE